MFGVFFDRMFWDEDGDCRCYSPSPQSKMNGKDLCIS